MKMAANDTFFGVNRKSTLWSKRNLLAACYIYFNESVNARTFCQLMNLEENYNLNIVWQSDNASRTCRKNTFQAWLPLQIAETRFCWFWSCQTFPEPVLLSIWRLRSMRKQQQRLLENHQSWWKKHKTESKYGPAEILVRPENKVLLDTYVKVIRSNAPGQKDPAVCIHWTGTQFDATGANKYPAIQCFKKVYSRRLSGRQES